MRIEHSEFGNISIDGKTYPHDVIISLSGEIRKRKKKLSKKKYGTSHIISKAEAKSVFEKGCDLLIVGAGQEGMRRRVAADPGGNSVVQSINGKEDWSHPCNLLTRSWCHCCLIDQ